MYVWRINFVWGFWKQDPPPTTHDPRATYPRPTTPDPRPTTHDPRPPTHDPPTHAIYPHPIKPSTLLLYHSVDYHQTLQNLSKR